MNTLELPNDACEMLCKCISHRIEYLRTINKVYWDVKEKEGWDDEVRDEYYDNHYEIVKLQTLKNYIESFTYIKS